MISLENEGKILNRLRCILWEIPNYFVRELKELPLIIRSPSFTYRGIEWQLILLPNSGGREFISLFLWKIADKRPFTLFPSYLFNVHLGLINIDGDWLHVIEGHTNSAGCFGSWTFQYLSTFRDKKHVWSPKGMLRFSCEISESLPVYSSPVTQENIIKNVDEDISENKNENDVSGSENDSEKTIKEVSEAKGIDRLVKNLKNLLINGQSSDATVKVEDREFKVHRGILMVRSPVFASMFQPETKESKTGIVDIADCSAEAFEIFLSYIYTGSVDAISCDNIFDLYYAADKYQTDDLKSDCVEFMEKNLSVENFCDIMTLSLQHCEKDLQKVATKFFCENVKVIIKTVQWQKYLKNFSVQANELYIKAINA